MKFRALESEKPAGPLPEVSVVIPLFNEAENVRPLYDSLTSAMKETGRTWEVVFVDDGSSDMTYEVLQELYEQYDGIHVVQLRRNFGQTAAMVAGFDHARGETIVAMDGDLQNDPRDIAQLLEKLEEGYDLVSGWRVQRKDSFWSRRLPSHVANWLISRVTGTHLHDYGCTLKAYQAEALRELRLYGEMHRFIPALISSNGARIAELPVHHHPRLNGQSKYGLSRVVYVLLDLLTVKFMLSFMTRPLRVFGIIGLGAFLSGVAVCAYLATMKLFWSYSLDERPLLLLGVLMIIVGAQSIGMGILAEIQIRTYQETSHKPVYVIRKILDVNSI